MMIVITYSLTLWITSSVCDSLQVTHMCGPLYILMYAIVLAWSNLEMKYRTFYSGSYTVSCAVTTSILALDEHVLLVSNLCEVHPLLKQSVTKNAVS